jgi:23S rRNA (pseudouridine1915-N3)-methyltransferase
MTFKIVCVGRIKETYYTDMIDAYKRQIGRKHELVIIQHEDEKIPQNASDTIKKKIVDTESHKCMESIGKSEYVIALCINGKKCTTELLREKIRQAELLGTGSESIRQAEDRGITTVTFLIGGSLGMSDELIRKADFKLSYSNMTFPHQLMRVMLLDQLQIICDM